MSGPRWGAEVQPGGVRFRVPAPDASQVAVCLFAPEERGATPPIGAPLERQVPLERDGDGWTGFVPGIGDGARYGYRAWGPRRPRDGLRFDPRCLLLDPWARRVDGSTAWHPSLEPGGRGDTAAVAPRGVVVARAAPIFTRPRRSPALVYEAQVRAATATHPGIPAPLRGTYLGLAHPAFVDHLVQLGVTALELLPIAQGFDERHVVDRGLRNAWGYATLAPLAVDRRFEAVPGQARQEVVALAHALHAAGIELWVDVVFNHTPEGGVRGPTLSYRGLGESAWYRWADGLQDCSGCGNTLDVRRPWVQALIRDALVDWHHELGVDGFRFDLAPTLLRTDRDGELVEALAADPALADARLVAEPWDLCPGGYRQGGFPRGWSEWNGRFRDAARAYWLGRPVRAELATRLAGSQDLFEGRSPSASVQFITCHDGFTLADLVSYDRRHNEANGEDNRDGWDDNRSSSWGGEGPARGPQQQAVRDAVRRGLLATLALARGTPMLSHGDEVGRTQRGNNNAWCQDNPLAWIDWSAADRALLDFTQRLFALRRALPPVVADRFLQGVGDGGAPADVVWLGPDGPLDAAAWRRPAVPLGMWLDGWLLTLWNGGGEPVRWSLPPGAWRLLLETSAPRWEGDAAGAWTQPARSVAVFAPEAPPRSAYPSASA